MSSAMNLNDGARIEPMQELDPIKKREVLIWFSPALRTLAEYARSVDQNMPVAADYIAIDSERVRMFDGEPEYSAGEDGKFRWRGNEVASWEYGNLDNLRGFFRFEPFISRGMFKYSRACVEF